MKKALIPREKLTKKQKRALNLKKRATWAFSPVTRVRQDKTVYRRKRKQARVDTDGD